MQNKSYDERRLNLFPSALFHQMGVNGKVSGAVFALGEIPNAIAVVHGAVGCGYHYRYSARTRNYPNYNVCSSQLGENEVIFGGEERLLETILEAYEQWKPELIAIVPTPVSDIIQDDLFAVARKATQRCGIPVICAKSELFSHRDKNYARKRLQKLAEQTLEETKSIDMDITGCGYSELLCALVTQLMEPQSVVPLTVAIETIAWGVMGNQIMDEIGHTLGRAGIRVTTYFPSASVQDIVTMPSVSLNLIRRNHWAKQMRDRFGTPFLELQSMRYQGVSGIKHFYQDIGNVLGIPEQMRAVVQAANAKALQETQQERKNIAQHKVYLITNNLSALAYHLKAYQENYQLNVIGCMVSLTPQTMKNSNITEELLEKLLSKANDSAQQYYPALDIHINLSWEALVRESQDADIIVGTADPRYERLGKPLVSTHDYEPSLSFESYVRSVRDLEQRLRRTQHHRELILNKLAFSQGYYPLLDRPSLIASREMWNKMWLERGNAT